jgi:hypothetical protein
MPTASSVKNNAARRHTIPPSMRRLIAIMEVSASLGTTSLAVVPPRAYPTGEELGSHRRDYGRLVVALEIELDSEIVLINALTGEVESPARTLPGLPG